MALASNCRMICEISRWSLSLQGGHWSFSILHTKSWHFTSLCFLATPSATGMSYFDQDNTPQYLVLPLFCLFIRSGWDSFCTPLLVLVLGLLSAQKTLALNWTRVQSVLDVKVRIHCRPPRFTATRFRYLKAKKRRKSDEDHGWKRLEGAGSSKPGSLRMVFSKDNLTCRTLQTTKK